MGHLSFHHRRPQEPFAQSLSPGRESTGPSGFWKPGSKVAFLGWERRAGSCVTLPAPYPHPRRLGALHSGARTGPPNARGLLEACWVWDLEEPRCGVCPGYHRIQPSPQRAQAATGSSFLRSVAGPEPWSLSSCCRWSQFTFLFSIFSPLSLSLSHLSPSPPPTTHKVEQAGEHGDCLFLCSKTELF